MYSPICAASSVAYSNLTVRPAGTNQNDVFDASYRNIRADSCAPLQIWVLNRYITMQQTIPDKILERYDHFVFNARDNKTTRSAETEPMWSLYAAQTPECVEKRCRRWYAGVDLSRQFTLTDQRKGLTRTLTWTSQVSRLTLAACSGVGSCTG